MSKCVRDTLGYMSLGRGNIPVRVFWAIESAPLRFRTFGGQDRNSNIAITDETIEHAFGGNYLLTLVTGSMASRYLHAGGSIQTLYIDGTIHRFFMRHGLLECELWDTVNHDVLDRELDDSFNYSWAYSACKPYATFSEAELSNGMPILFHDSDLILRHSFDKILGLRNHDDLSMAVGHLESIGTPFYPPLETIPLPSCFEFSDGMLTNTNTGLSYETGLDAVNTCLMYFSDMSLASEWAGLFRDMMKDNHAEAPDFLTREQLLLGADQRPGLMVAYRRGLKLMKDVGLFVPMTWTGETFEGLPGTPSREWHYYRPEYVPGKNWCQDIVHTWIQKRDIERCMPYDLYMGRFHLELLEAITRELGLNWERLEHSLRSFPSLSRYFELYDDGRSIEELIESGRVSNLLMKGL